MDPGSLLLVAYMMLFGSLIGSVSGLVPGIHVNTLAALLLAGYPVLASLLSSAVCPSMLPVMVAAAVVSASVVHSFMDFVPSVFLGSPGEEDVLSVLPGHRMLMGGKGAEAVACSAQGSLVGAAAAVVLALPVHLAMESGGWETLQRHIPFMLPACLLLMILSERGDSAPRKRAWAVSLCLASGVLGTVTMFGSMPASAGMVQAGGLMLPMLAGLFGMPALLISLGAGGVPVQTGSALPTVDSGPALRGLVAGLAVGWLPGVTSTAGTVVASLGSPERTPERFIAMVSSVGTAATVFALVTLSVAGRGRTGTMLVVSDVMGDGLRGLDNPHFALLLLCVLASAVLGYLLTVRAGAFFARALQGRDLWRLNLAIALFLCVLVLAVSGPGGLLMLVAGTCLGLLPSAAGVGRVHLTGSLLLPVMLFYTGAQPFLTGLL